MNFWHASSSTSTGQLNYYILNHSIIVSPLFDFRYRILRSTLRTFNLKKKSKMSCTLRHQCWGQGDLGAALQPSYKINAESNFRLQSRWWWRANQTLLSLPGTTWPGWSGWYLVFFLKDILHWICQQFGDVGYVDCDCQLFNKSPVWLSTIYGLHLHPLLRCSFWPFWSAM